MQLWKFLIPVGEPLYADCLPHGFIEGFLLMVVASDAVEARHLAKSFLMGDASWLDLIEPTIVPLDNARIVAYAQVNHE